MNENVSDYLSLLGYVLLRSGKHARAVVILEALLALEPQNHWARRTLAYGYLACGEYERSLAELDLLAASSQEHELLIRVRALWGLERFDEARDIVRQLNGKLRNPNG